MNQRSVWDVGEPNSSAIQLSLPHGNAHLILYFQPAHIIYDVSFLQMSIYLSLFLPVLVFVFLLFLMFQESLCSFLYTSRASFRAGVLVTVL